jgi:hypothetical protein
MRLLRNLISVVVQLNIALYYYIRDLIDAYQAARIQRLIDELEADVNTALEDYYKIFPSK